jgi:hypothetical protein
MRTELKQVDKLVITDTEHIDSSYGAINVFLEDFGDKQGKITIECDCDSWAYYWGSMNDRIAHFFCDCNVSYLAGKLKTTDSSVIDYDDIIPELKQEIIRSRRDGDSSKQWARETFDRLHYFTFRDEYELGEGDDILSEILGGDWHTGLPHKTHPDYRHLCNIITAVQEGIKAAGLLNKQGEDNEQ